MSDFWVQLLSTEDECKQRVEEAERRGKELREQKSKEATEKVDQLKKQYQTEIENKKQNAIKEIEDLKKSLRNEQEQKSKEAADKFRTHKDAIIDLLLKTVLDVRVE